MSRRRELGIGNWDGLGQTTLVVRSLRYYWRTNLAVALGVAVAVSALAGALVVGRSVQHSLRELAVSRLGRTDHLVTANLLFTEPLAERVASAPAFRAGWDGAVPLLVLEATATHERSGRRAGSVQVFGVDDRFWRFNGISGVEGPAGRDGFINAALGQELGAASGDALIVRVHKPSQIPPGVIQGRRNQPGSAVRLNIARALSDAQLGGFSLRPQQGAVRTVFVALDRLQRDLELPHRINVMLFAAPHVHAADASTLSSLIGQKVDLADLGIRIRPVTGGLLAIESDAGLLTDEIARGVNDAAKETRVASNPILTYLATTIRANGRETPYSLVSAVPDSLIEGRLPASAEAPARPRRSAPPARAGGKPGPTYAGASVGSRFSGSNANPIWLSRWEADDLVARVGDRVTLDYYLWSDEEGLTTATAEFIVAGIGAGMNGMPDLTPDYPGISTTANIRDWDPPFPIDLNRIRPKDEEYWDRYRTAPKAFIRLADGQALWKSRYGQVSSIWLGGGELPIAEIHAAMRQALPGHLDASMAGFRIVPVRADALASAAGTTDFGEYFTYFSVFLVISSLLLAILFFRLAIEQRAAQIGLLLAIGYTTRAIRRALLLEALVVAVGGAVLGMAGALAYSAAILFALRTWWVDAVGTTDLALHPSIRTLCLGAAAGVIAGLACAAWTLRVLRRSSARQLLSGAWVEPVVSTSRPQRLRGGAVAAFVLGLALVALCAAGALPLTPGFFASGSLLLVSGSCALAAWLRGRPRRSFADARWPLARLGLRSVRYRPSRSVLSVALVAAATFVIVSVGAFRRGIDAVDDPQSSSGGFALIAETVSPLMHDPSTRIGRDALDLGPELEGIRIARFRLRPGDDASCLNLYRPTSPRLLGATDTFIRSNRFSFAGTIAASESERQNPWLLLNRRFDDGAVPVIGDATSLTYAFHRSVGSDFVMSGPDGKPLRMRIVAALRDSVLQSELVISDAHFTRLFPRHDGFRVFLIEVDAPRAAAVAEALEDRLQDYGVDVQSTERRLASYHRVENTFLTAFQMLGALGLVLGTFGLGTVLLRNVLERRRELALLRATGYRHAHLVMIVLAESIFLLACGLALGITCALVAIAPAYLQRGQPFPIAGTIALLSAVVAAGMLSTVAAARAATSSALLTALRND